MWMQFNVMPRTQYIIIISFYSYSKYNQSTTNIAHIQVISLSQSDLADATWRAVDWQVVEIDRMMREVALNSSDGVKTLVKMVVTGGSDEHKLVVRVIEVCSENIDRKSETR